MLIMVTTALGSDATRGGSPGRHLKSKGSERFGGGFKKIKCIFIKRKKKESHKG